MDKRIIVIFMCTLLIINVLPVKGKKDEKNEKIEEKILVPNTIIVLIFGEIIPQAAFALYRCQ